MIQTPLEFTDGTGRYILSKLNFPVGKARDNEMVLNFNHTPTVPIEISKNDNQKPSDRVRINTRKLKKK